MRECMNTNGSYYCSNCSIPLLNDGRLNCKCPQPFIRINNENNICECPENTTIINNTCQCTLGQIKSGNYCIPNNINVDYDSQIVITSSTTITSFQSNGNVIIKFSNGKPPQIFISENANFSGTLTLD